MMSMFFTPYKFEFHDGLPPDGEPGQYFGFDKGGYAYILRWSDRGPCWVAMGFANRDAHLPHIVMCREECAEFIVSWAQTPVPWADFETVPTLESD